MTCVAAIKDEGRIWIGGDSAGVAGTDLTVRSDPKVFVVKNIAFGFTDSFRMGQLLMFSFKPPPITKPGKKDRDLFEYMATDFVDSVRKCFQKGGYAKLKDSEEEGGTFIVGIRDRLFVIDDDYQVGEPLDPFVAVGCGDQIAHGAMHALMNSQTKFKTKMKAKDIIVQALKAAERFSGGVRAPFTIVSIDSNG
jgi:ATP-dependent protease HslVU (ClpYQ) peptidase subunit